MRFSFDRLMGIAERTFNQDPLSGHLFLFVNRYRNRIKILYWDRDGFCIWYKRLECGFFELPASGPVGVAIVGRPRSAQRAPSSAPVSPRRPK
jgi:transposase